MDKSTSTYLRVGAVDTHLSKYKDGECLRRARSLEREFKLVNLGRWRSCVSKVSSSSVFEGWRSCVSKVSSSSVFEGPPPRLKSWNSYLGARGVPLGDKSGLVADWSTLVDIWERAAHVKVEQGKHDQGLVDLPRPISDQPRLVTQWDAACTKIGIPTF